MIDPAMVGSEYWSATVAVEAGALLRFGATVGADGPRPGGAPLEAPAAFLLALVPFDAFAAVVGASARQIHPSEFQIDQLRSVVAGDRLVVRSRISDVTRHPAAGGTTAVVTVDDEGRDAATGEAVYRARRVYAVLAAREAA